MRSGPSPPPSPRTNRRKPRSTQPDEGGKRTSEGQAPTTSDENAIAHLPLSQQNTYRIYREAQESHEMALAAAMTICSAPPHHPAANVDEPPPASGTDGPPSAAEAQLSHEREEIYMLHLQAGFPPAEALQIALQNPAEEPPNDTQPSPPPPPAPVESDERAAKRSRTRAAPTPPQPPPPQERQLQPPPLPPPRRWKRLVNKQGKDTMIAQARGEPCPAPSPAVTPPRQQGSASDAGSPSRSSGSSSSEATTQKRKTPAVHATSRRNAASGGGHGNSARKRRARGGRRRHEEQLPTTDEAAHKKMPASSTSSGSSDEEERMRKLPRRGTGRVGERGGGGTRGIRARLRRLTHPRVGAGRAGHKGSGGRETGRDRGGGRRQAAAAGTKRKRGDGAAAEGTGAGRGAGAGGLRRGVRRRLGDDQIEGREGAEGATDRRGIDGRGWSSVIDD